ncbi:MAG: hypothetical protein EAZ85_01100 [Bacteroidetes bacterium]|nr:MAG: hypothetical protein EAZ85_01100 [Bacteroidota bacterium]
MFPKKIFEDIKSSDFQKHNKKQVTEDFVTENFKACFWNVYRPFNDTGIDLIATKKVCPNNHTQFDDNTISIKKCPNCHKEFINIERFIQVKTREIKGEEGESMFFGYTLKSKDFRTDPRHIFLFYSDATNDFLIVPMFDYLQFFHQKEIGKSHFGTPSFRIGNNKLNSLKRNEKSIWEWKGRETYSFMQFLNEKGMELIVNPNYDLKLNDYISKITEMKFDLFYDYSAGRQIDKSQQEVFNQILQKQVKQNLKDIAKKRVERRKKLIKTIDNQLVISIKKYFEKFKNFDFQ